MEYVSMPWEISAVAAGVALLALGLAATLTLLEVRRTARNISKLTETMDRHLPAILQNLDEISRSGVVLTSSIRTLFKKTETTGEGLEEVSRAIHSTVQSLEADVIDPIRKTIKGVSALLAFGAALRGSRHALGLLMPRRGKGRA